jgi:hypothetical protein
MPLSFVRRVGHDSKAGAYIFTMRDGMTEVECAISDAALEARPKRHQTDPVTNEDRDDAFEKELDRICRVASGKYEAGIIELNGPRIWIRFEEYSTRQYP